MTRQLEAANALDRIEEAVIARQQRQVQAAQQEELQQQNGAQMERVECQGHCS